MRVAGSRSWFRTARHSARRRQMLTALGGALLWLGLGLGMGLSYAAYAEPALAPALETAPATDAAQREQTPSARPFPWPQGAKAAVSLAYDDALPSQLATAVPQLAKAGFRASFYLPLAAETVSSQLEQWRAVAAAGHELGNHSLFHQCAGNLANRQWVSADRDLTTTSASRMQAEVRLANQYLTAIDGRTERTYTAPCTDALAMGQPYLPGLRADFVAMKTTVGTVVADMWQLDVYAVPVIAPEGVTGETLISYVKQAKAQGTMVNFTFHGIGGDHLAVSASAHQQLLDYLAAHRHELWVAPFVEQMRHVKAMQASQ